jgi:hypothetical protein
MTEILTSPCRITVTSATSLASFISRVFNKMSTFHFLLRLESVQIQCNTWLEPTEHVVYDTFTINCENSRDTVCVDGYLVILFNQPSNFGDAQTHTDMPSEFQNADFRIVMNEVSDTVHAMASGLTSVRWVLFTQIF